MEVMVESNIFTIAFYSRHLRNKQWRRGKRFEKMPRRSSKGVFVTISVFFLALALLFMVGLLAGIESGKKQSFSEASDLAEVNSIKSNVEWMAKETFSVSGFRYSVNNQTLSIEENASKRGSLSFGLDALEEFWNGIAKKDVSLVFSESASTPIIHIEPVGIVLIQSPVNTSVLVPGYANSSVNAYHLKIKSSCSELSRTWNNISESTDPDALNFTLDVECTDSTESLSVFRQLDRFGYSELQVRESGGNLTVVEIADSSLKVRKYKSAYLNIIMPMNEVVYFEIPSSLSITKGNARFSGALRIPGDLE